MRKMKKILAVLLVMVTLCGVAAIGVSAADAKTPVGLTAAQTKELKGYMQTNVPIMAIETALKLVPRFLNWTAFSKDSNFAALQADLKAELKKAGLDYDEVVKDFIAFSTNGPQVLAYNKVIAEKGPELFKKHGVFYVDWLMDIIVWVSKVF